MAPVKHDASGKELADAKQTVHLLDQDVGFNEYWNAFEIKCRKPDATYLAEGGSIAIKGDRQVKVAHMDDRGAAILIGEKNRNDGKHRYTIEQYVDRGSAFVFLDQPLIEGQEEKRSDRTDIYVYLCKMPNVPGLLKMVKTTPIEIAGLVRAEKEEAPEAVRENRENLRFRKKSMSVK